MDQLSAERRRGLSLVSRRACAAHQAPIRMVCVPGHRPYRRGMTKYLITFPSDAMDHIPQEERPAVTRAARACCQELIDAGAYVLAGGLEDQPASLVATDGGVST